MTLVAIVRSPDCSTIITPEWLSTQLAPDLEIQLVRDYAPAWGVDPRSLSVDPTVYTTIEETPPHARVLDFVGPDPAVGAAAFHLERTDGRMWMPVGTAGKSRDDVSSAASHEVLEDDQDPNINAWVDFAPLPGWKVMREIGDPVQSRGYRVREGGVLLSSFVFPAWFDPFGAAPFDFLDDLSAPFTRIPGDGGDYMLLLDPSGVRSQEPAGVRVRRRALAALRGGG